MRRVLVTGSSGFVGQTVVVHLLGAGYEVVGCDLLPANGRVPTHPHVVGDIRSNDLWHQLERYGIDRIVHCAAAVVSQAVRDPGTVRSTNVVGTEQVVAFARRAGVRKIVFISTCCLWKSSMHRAVLETDTPDPGEVYGLTKLRGEHLLLGEGRRTGGFDAVILRSPTVVGARRIGYFSLLYDFVFQGKRVWVVGSGNNRQQFVSDEDLAVACRLGLEYANTDVFNVGSDEVRTLRTLYGDLIDFAGSESKVTSLPATMTLLGMRAAYRLGISPLGPYHYRMIAEDFVFDTSKAKRVLGWSPTATNTEMLLDGYKYYVAHRDEVHADDTLSEHQRPARMGVIRLLKWVS